MLESELREPRLELLHGSVMCLISDRVVLALRARQLHSGLVVAHQREVEVDVVGNSVVRTIGDPLWVNRLVGQGVGASAVLAVRLQLAVDLVLLFQEILR